MLGGNQARWRSGPLTLTPEVPWTPDPNPRGPLAELWSVEGHGGAQLVEALDLVSGPGPGSSSVLLSDVVSSVSPGWMDTFIKNECNLTLISFTAAPISDVTGGDSSSFYMLYVTTPKRRKVSLK